MIAKLSFTQTGSPRKEGRIKYQPWRNFIMNRREFIKSASAVAAVGAVSDIVAKADPDGDKLTDPPTAEQTVTRRNYRDTKQTVPLLGFGTMRLPRVTPGKPEIDYKKTKEMFAIAMKAGCNYFDTAYMYHDGLSETCCGDLLSEYDRDSYYLADKMPVWYCKSEADVERIFNEQLKKTKAGYFDFYLIHALDAGKWKKAKQVRAYEFLAKMKETGKIRRLGFSFHDTPEVLKEIASERPWDFAQIQLNYLDWEAYRSREQYEILTELKIPVVIMEPIRGGALAVLNDTATEILKNANPKVSTASWALRYAASLPNVLCVLSGMSLPEHVEDNIKTFTPFVPLTDKERETLQLALTAYQEKLAVPCTACRYCLPCPTGVEIPFIFGQFNQYKGTGRKGAFLRNYGSLGEEADATACIQCEKCVEKCPQHIKIPVELEKIAKAVAELTKK